MRGTSRCDSETSHESKTLNSSEVELGVGVGLGLGLGVRARG